MHIFFHKNKANIYKILTFLCVTLLLILFMKFMGSYAAPFIIGWILSRILSLPVDLMHKKFKLNRGICVLLTMCGLFFLLFWGAQVITTKLVTEASALIDDAPRYYDTLQSSLNSLQSMYADFFDFIPQELKSLWENLASSLLLGVTGMLGNFLKDGSVRFVSALPSAFAITIVALVSLYFFLRDKEMLDGFVKRQLPESWSYTINLIKKDIFGALWGYIKAQLILMCFNGVICIVGLIILRSPYAFLMGIIICIVDVLPIFGTGFILWPWALFSLITGNISFAAGLICIYLVVLVVRQIMEPRILGAQIGLHPLVTLASVYIGLKLCGIPGIILGPLFVIIVKSLQKDELLPDWK